MRKKAVLACGDCGSRNYSTTANKEKADRLELKKFCGICNKQTIHRETK